MRIAVFGANGPTGRALVDDALARGHEVRAVTRHPDTFPIQHDQLEVVKADVEDGSSLREAIAGCDAVASVLGAPYGRKRITVYSAGVRGILAAMDEVGCKRIVVVTAGIAHGNPGGYGFFFDFVIHPILHKIVGRTLYADMRAMEALLWDRPDLEWTIIRPGRLTDGEASEAYHKIPENEDHLHPTSYINTTRPDLAKAILDDLEQGDDVRSAVSVMSA